jgi:hypothetical protein
VEKLTANHTKEPMKRIQQPATSTTTTATPVARGDDEIRPGPMGSISPTPNWLHSTSRQPLSTKTEPGIKLSGRAEEIRLYCVVIATIIALFPIGGYVINHYSSGPLGPFLASIAFVVVIGVGLIISFLKASEKAVHFYRRFVPMLLGLGVAKLCVFAYLMFVFGTLVFAPWEGWEVNQKEYRADSRVNWTHATRFGPIFSPPAYLYGVNPKSTDDYKQSQRAIATPPRLKTEVIALLWGALGIATIAIVWLSSGKRTTSKPDSAEVST